MSLAGEEIESTANHPYWVISGIGLPFRTQPEHAPETLVGVKLPGRWVDAIELQVGDVLLLKSGERVKVRAKSVRRFVGPVYNFHVADVHSYAVGQCAVLVHNKTCLPKVTNKGKPISKADKKKKNGSYTITFSNGKKYHGKEPVKRAMASAQRIATKNKLGVTKIDWSPAKNARSAFKKEYLRMKPDGGPNAAKNYNLIWSPGRYY